MTDAELAAGKVDPAETADVGREVASVLTVAADRGRVVSKVTSVRNEAAESGREGSEELNDTALDGRRLPALCSGFSV